MLRPCPTTGHYGCPMMMMMMMMVAVVIMMISSCSIVWSVMLPL